MTGFNKNYCSPSLQLIKKICWATKLFKLVLFVQIVVNSTMKCIILLHLQHHKSLFSKYLLTVFFHCSLAAIRSHGKLHGTSKGALATSANEIEEAGRSIAVPLDFSFLCLTTVEGTRLYCIVLYKSIAQWHAQLTLHFTKFHPSSVYHYFFIFFTFFLLVSCTLKESQMSHSIGKITLCNGKTSSTEPLTTWSSHIICFQSHGHVKPNLIEHAYYLLSCWVNQCWIFSSAKPLKECWGFLMSPPWVRNLGAVSFIPLFSLSICISPLLFFCLVLLLFLSNILFCFWLTLLTSFSLNHFPKGRLFCVALVFLFLLSG